MRVAFQRIEGPRRKHVFDGCSRHYAKIAGELSTDDYERGGVFNLVDGANVASLLKELELREDHFYAMTSSKPLHYNRLDGKDNRADGATANALFTNQEHGNCAFCLGKHAHEYCQRVKDPKERKSIVFKFANVLNV